MTSNCIMTKNVVLVLPSVLRVLYAIGTVEGKTFGCEKRNKAVTEVS